MYHFLRRADMVLGIGCSFAISGFAVPIPAGKTLIHATNDPDDINKDHPCRYPLVGDAKLVLAQLLDELRQQAGAAGRPVNQALAEEIASVKQAWLAKWLPKLTADEDPINPYRVVWDLMHTVDLDNVIITHESGASASSWCRSGKRASHGVSSVGASRRSWAIAWAWRWAPSWRRLRRTSST